MIRYAVFYLPVGPYGTVPSPVEAFICYARHSGQAVEMCLDAHPKAAIQFVTVEVLRK